MCHDIVTAQCRAALRDRTYSAARSAAFITWLKEPDAAVADLAGHALAAIGPAAFEDLLLVVTAPGTTPCPNAVWALALFDEKHERLLPWLRSWLDSTTDGLERQCALSLAGVVMNRRRLGHVPDESDLAACRRVLERDSLTCPSLRVTLRTLRKELPEWPS